MILVETKWPIGVQIQAIIPTVHTLLIVELALRYQMAKGGELK